MPATKVHATILSLGAGIGSTAMALLLEQGILPGYAKPEAALFADTKSEPPHVYETVEWLRQYLSYPIITVSSGDLGANTWKALSRLPVPERGHHKAGYIDIPVFSESGIGRRQCTGFYKIKPIKAKIRELTNSKPPALTATQYLGISADEPKRIKPSQQKWLTSVYPLYDHGWTRAQCKQFLDDEYPGNPVRRSACYFCPYHTRAEWQEIKQLYPNLYQDAVAMDRALAEHPTGPWRLKQGGLEKSLAKQELQPPLL